MPRLWRATVNGINMRAANRPASPRKLSVSNDPTPTPAPRLAALDVFRGATIVAMILVNNPGDRSVTWSQLLHSPWHGFTFADTIFPAFLWIVGFAMILSMRARLERGASRRELALHSLKRAAILFACGLFLEGFPYFDPDHYQVTGVLQKIAVSYLIAHSVCLLCDWRGQLIAQALLYVAYIAFMLGMQPAGCGDDVWSATCNASKHLNDALLGAHLWSTPSANDPDGVLGCISATASVLLGVLGAQLFSSRGAAAVAPRRLLMLGCGLLLLGTALGRWIPINKILWTPSYSLLMAGLAAVTFVVTWWLVDSRNLGRWFHPLRVFGLNALAAYILSRLGVDLLKKQFFGWSIYHNMLMVYTRPAIASFLFACLNVVAVYLIVWGMYRARIFIKL
jgi:predicted acyltransferase